MSTIYAVVVRLIEYWPVNGVLVVEVGRLADGQYLRTEIPS